jgi:hypothetical protein
MTPCSHRVSLIVEARASQGIAWTRQPWHACPLSIPSDIASSVTQAAAAPDAAPRSCCRGPEPAQPPLLVEQLLTQLREAFQAEKDAGFTIDNDQDPVSFKRLNDRVQGLLKVRSPTQVAGFAVAHCP